MTGKAKAGVAGMLALVAGGIAMWMGAHGIAAGLIVAGLADLAFDGLKLAARTARRQWKGRQSV